MKVLVVLSLVEGVNRLANYGGSRKSMTNHTLIERIYQIIDNILRGRSCLMFGNLPVVREWGATYGQTLRKSVRPGREVVLKYYFGLKRYFASVEVELV
jgi:hypothetical protein